MKLFSNFRHALPPFALSSTGRSTLRPTAPQVRDCCDEILVDVPEPQRRVVISALPRLRRAADMLELRSSLYSAIARAHGETVARERLSHFDGCVDAG